MSFKNVVVFIRVKIETLKLMNIKDNCSVHNLNLNKSNYKSIKEILIGLIA